MTAWLPLNAEVGIKVPCHPDSLGLGCQCQSLPHICLPEGLHPLLTHEQFHLLTDILLTLSWSLYKIAIKIHEELWQVNLQVSVSIWKPGARSKASAFTRRHPGRVCILHSLAEPKKTVIIAHRNAFKFLEFIIIGFFQPWFSSGHNSQRNPMLTLPWILLVT